MLTVLSVMLTVTCLQAQEKPNVVVIIVDDLGYADMSFLPQAPADVKHYKAQGFDRLAATGTYFENAYATSPDLQSIACRDLVPINSVGAVLYGDGDLPNKVTLQEMLSSNGYATAKYGKTHLSEAGEKVPTLHGFDEYLGFMHITLGIISVSVRKMLMLIKRKKGLKILVVRSLVHW